jgi:hypothetical protein
MNRLLALFATIGASPGDTEDESLRRGLLVGLALAISVLAIVWGLIYVAVGEPLGGAIPLTYTVISLLDSGMVHRRYACSAAGVMATTVQPGRWSRSGINVLQ